MARNNRMSATFAMDSGDGASGFTEQYGTTTFTSGDCVKIDGTVNGQQTFTVADYGMAQADGFYLENRSPTNELTVSMTNGVSPAIVEALKIAPNGVFMFRQDPDANALIQVALTGQGEFVLILAE
tara:strand:+ start:529 stop:906 length:378 start_codon:yes stop_codon:yes gene_type:complete